jgi:hypothetical protein
MLSGALVKEPGRRALDLAEISSWASAVDYEALTS